VADKGFLYIKDVGSGVEELFYEDEAGNEIQITSGNYVAAPFASGTKMWFFQNTAPTGWTIDSTPADSLLAVKGGSGAFNVNGGTEAGTWQIPDTEGHVLTIAEMPAHAHTMGSWAAGSGVGTGNFSIEGTTLNTSTVGGGGGHVHTQVDTWRPLAQVGIICEKD